MMLNVGTKNRARVFIHIINNRDGLDGNYLSITGVIAPNKHGSARGGCGQIIMEFYGSNRDRLYKLEDMHFISPEWNINKFNTLLSMWDLWRLKENVPDEVIDWLDNLPDTKVIPAWI